jgi:regulatory protein
MATVTGIREFRGVVRISLDGREALVVRARHFRMRPLSEGDAVDAGAYADQIASIQLSDAYEAALSSLDFQARTEREIARALASKGYVAPAVDAVIERLRENRLLDDRQYAMRAAEVSANRAVGVYALKRKLRMKGVSDEDAEEAMALLDARQQSDAAGQAAEKLLRKYEHLPAREAKAKLSQALARRGFSWDAIRETVEALISGGDWD